MMVRDPWFYEVVWEKMKKGKKPEPQHVSTHRSEVTFMVTMTLKTE